MLDHFKKMNIAILYCYGLPRIWVLTLIPGSAKIRNFFSLQQGNGVNF